MSYAFSTYHVSPEDPPATAERQGNNVCLRFDGSAGAVNVLINADDSARLLALAEVIGHAATAAQPEVTC